MSKTAANSEAQRLAERAAAALFERDQASRALGMRLRGVRRGWAQVDMRVRPDMTNGHGVCHGGIVFALGDSAFAFACNSYNEATVAAAASIDFLAAAHAGDELTAEASELWRTPAQRALRDHRVQPARGTHRAVSRTLLPHRRSGRRRGVRRMQLESFVAGSWRAGDGGGVALRDATTGEVIAHAGSAGPDARAMLEHARDVGGPNLRKLTFHERALQLKALAKLLTDLKAEFYAALVRYGGHQE